MGGRLKAALPVLRFRRRNPRGFLHHLRRYEVFSPSRLRQTILHTHDREHSSSEKQFRGQHLCGGALEQFPGPA